jgi:hypothetical protein
MKMVFKIPVFAFEKEADSLGHLSVLLGGDQSGTGSETSVDLVFDARPFDRLSEIQGAGGQGKEPRDGSEGLPERSWIGIGSKVEVPPGADAACHGEARIGFGPGKTEIGIGLVIPKKDIEAGSVLFDQSVFENQGIKFTPGHQGFDVLDPIRHLPDPGGGRTCLLEIGSDPVFQALRFSHIKNLVMRTLHQIDSGRVGKQPEFFFQSEG